MNLLKSRNIKLVIEYDGTGYRGWQVQQSGVGNRGGKARSGTAVLTIQGTLQEAIREITGEDVAITGAGRTDAGVHARGQVANFHTASDITVERFPFAVNAHLPPAIAIKSAEEVPTGFNARRNAKAREYMYVINNHRFRSALARLYSFHVPSMLDVGAMMQAAQNFKGEHDFSGFTCTDSHKKSLDAPHPPWSKAAGDPGEHTVGEPLNIQRPGGVRNIMDLGIERRMEFIYVTVKANSFLMHMVRYIVAALLEVGREHMGPEDIKLYLGPSPRKWTHSRAPAKGLFLMKVEY